MSRRTVSFIRSIAGVRRKMIGAVGAFLALLSATSGVDARTLEVGTGRAFPEPSAAISAAAPGDTIEIAPGTYYDCAVWQQAHLTISGSGPGVIITDKTCQGKALFVIAGDDATIKNLTLQRARVADGNGAGIRAEATNLTIDNVRFINNEDGILAADMPDSVIAIRHSAFVDNGSCRNQGGCAHGIYVNHIKMLKIETSRFFQTKEGHHIKSKAEKTILIGDTIEDGPQGTASYLVDIPNGGSLIMNDDILEKGPLNQNHTTAVTIGEEGVTQPTEEISITNCKFTNDGPPTEFVQNLTATDATLSGNTLAGNSITPLSGDGTVH